MKLLVLQDNPNDILMSKVNVKILKFKANIGKMIHCKLGLFEFCIQSALCETGPNIRYFQIVSVCRQHHHIISN